MTSTDGDPKRPGYRGALPERDDRLARVWLIVVAAIFAGILLLSILGIPSRFIPEPTPVPTPVPTPTPSATESASPSGTDSASPSASVSASPSPSATVPPSPSP